MDVLLWLLLDGNYKIVQLIWGNNCTVYRFIVTDEQGLYYVRNISRCKKDWNPSVEQPGKYLLVVKSGRKVVYQKENKRRRKINHVAMKSRKKKTNSKH